VANFNPWQTKTNHGLNLATAIILENGTGKITLSTKN